MPLLKDSPEGKTHHYGDGCFPPHLPPTEGASTEDLHYKPVHKNNEIRIKQIGNGFLIERIYEDDIEFFAITEKEKDTDHIKELLEHIAEWAGYHYNKWGEDNLIINFDGKDHKVE